MLYPQLQALPLFVTPLRGSPQTLNKRSGDKEDFWFYKRSGDQEIRRSGDQEIRRSGDQEIRRSGDQEVTLLNSPMRTGAH
jgi:hypothetical protein